MKKPQILVVEDESLVAKDIQRTLESLGYEVPVTASSGEGAIQKTEEQKPDLVLMDIVLKGEIDGIEAACEIRSHFNIPVVYLTAYTDQKKLQKAILTEPFGYIVKPFKERELKTTIEMALYKAKMESRLKLLAEELEDKNWKLQKSRQGFYNIVEKNTDGIVVVNKNGVIRFVNASAESLFGRKSGVLQGQLFGFPIVKGEMIEIDIIRSNGQKGVAEMRMRETEWEDNLAFLVSIRDITELKRMEKIKAEIDEHVRIERLKGEFISTVSHELRTPLTTMKEFMSIISDEIPGKLTKEQREYVDIVKGNIDRLTRLINNLLDISKIESGKVELKKTLVDIANLANSIILGLRLEAEGRHIEFKTLFPPAAVNVYADPDKIIQVFTNLISNAIKFTPEKGKIAVEIKDAEKEVECSVVDTGKGIAQDNIGKLFAKFQQIDRVAGAGAKGTGLGLAISKELVEMHNGKIWAESKIDEGSKFTFTLPKYGKEDILRETIEEKIAAARKDYKEFSIFIIRLDDYPECEKVFGENRAQKVFLPISAALEKVIRRGDFVTDKNEIFAFAQVNKQEVSKVIAQLKMAIKMPIFEIEKQFKMGFSYGYATYPADADNAKDLLEQVYKSCVREREERLKKAIMIVDDEPEARNIVRNILKASGYSNFFEAGNGEEALEKIKTAIPDLLILDMKMPRINGYELIGMLKENTKTKDIPVLIMSGYAVEIDKLEEYVKKKAIPVVGKPLDTKQLNKLVNYLL